MMGKTETRPNRPRDGRHCDLCGCSQPAVRCDKCGCQIFCLSCDDMYHRHPKRRFHLRKAVDPTPPIPQARPVLPMKVSHLPTTPGDPSKMPLPPPRKKKPGKSFFDTFRRGSPSSDVSPTLPKKEYSWTDRLGSIKKFMSNRPLPPLPVNSDNEEAQPAPSSDLQKRDLSFIHKRVDDKPPQLPQRSMKPHEFPGDKENQPRDAGGHFNPEMRNGTMDAVHMNRNRGYSLGDENQWAARMMDTQSSPQQFATLTRQNQHVFTHQGGPNYPVNHAATMHQSSSATDLHKMANVDGMPLPGMPPPHYPHYPMNPHLPPHYPYPMYPQYPNYPQYFGNSFANLSNPPTTDGDVSDSEASSRHHSGKKYPFRKRAKRSQSVMVDRMAYPGQFYPFGPFPPGYGPGPWGPPVPMDAPPSPASSVRSLNRVGRTRRRKKAASEDDDEEFSMSSSPMSRPKSSSSERPPRSPRKAPLATQTTSSEETSDSGRRKETISNSSEKLPQRDSSSRRTESPVPGSPHGESKKTQKQRRRETSKLSDVEAPVTANIKNDRRSSRESNADQNDAGQRPATATHTREWQCKHCTFINSSDNRICQVCCKTASPLQGTAVSTSRSSSACAGSRKHSPQSDDDRRSPVKKMEVENNKTNLDDKQDMENLNSALDEAEKEISRGLEELMKLKDDFLSEAPPVQKSSESQNQLTSDSGDSPEKSKPVYKSTGKMRTSILDKLNLATNKQPAKSTASTSTSTETQTGPPRNDSGWTPGNVTEIRRASNSSTTSETYNSPIAQSPELKRMNPPNDSSSRKDSSCQTQQDTLLEYLERKKAEEEAYFGRLGASNAFGYGDRMDTITSPLPAMYDRPFLGGFGLMQRSHSRASLFSGRLNDTGPMDFGNAGFGFGPAPMYRSVSRSSLTGDYPDSRLSEFHNLRKPDYYLSMEELVERRRQETMRAQGLELVRMIREAEQQGFTAEDIQIALSKCGKQTPIDWLQDNWRNMVDSVVTLSTNYGNDKKENDIGVLSESEAREALRLHKGNIWAAVTECVEGRQRKFLELSARGKFSRKDIVDALTTSEGDVEGAYAKLTKSTSKPFLMRIWGSGEGVQNQDGAMPMTMDDVESIEDRQKPEEECVESDEIWEEDVDWEDDDEEPDEEEEGDLDDLQQGEDDDYHSQEMKTPESDKSDYCDAFSSGTLERNTASPSSDDVFFVIPTQTETKKKGTGFLSKLASLRSQNKDQNSGTSTFYGTELVPSKTNIIESDTVEEASFNSGQSKNYGPFNILKNTISAIKDTVTGSSRNEKKLPCSTPERRTIIVKGQIPHESLVSNNDTNSVVLTSVKPVATEEASDFPPELEMKNTHQNNIEKIVEQQTSNLHISDANNFPLNTNLTIKSSSYTEMKNHANSLEIQATNIEKKKLLEKEQTKAKLPINGTEFLGAEDKNSVHKGRENLSTRDSKTTVQENESLADKSHKTIENSTEITSLEQNLSNKNAGIYKIKYEKAESKTQMKEEDISSNKSGTSKSLTPDKEEIPNAFVKNATNASDETLNSHMESHKGNIKKVQQPKSNSLTPLSSEPEISVAETSKEESEQNENQSSETMHLVPSTSKIKSLDNRHTDDSDLFQTDARLPQSPSFSLTNEIQSTDVQNSKLLNVTATTTVNNTAIEEHIANDSGVPNVLPSKDNKSEKAEVRAKNKSQEYVKPLVKDVNSTEATIAQANKNQLNDSLIKQDKSLTEIATALETISQPPVAEKDYLPTAKTEHGSEKKSDNLVSEPSNKLLEVDTEIKEVHSTPSHSTSENNLLVEKQNTDELKALTADDVKETIIVSVDSVIVHDPTTTETGEAFFQETVREVLENGRKAEQKSQLNEAAENTTCNSDTNDPKIKETNESRIDISDSITKSSSAVRSNASPVPLNSQSTKSKSTPVPDSSYSVLESTSVPDSSNPVLESTSVPDSSYPVLENSSSFTESPVSDANVSSQVFEISTPVVECSSSSTELSSFMPKNNSTDENAPLISEDASSSVLENNTLGDKNGILASECLSSKESMSLPSSSAQLSEDTPLNTENISPKPTDIDRIIKRESPLPETKIIDASNEINEVCSSELTEMGTSETHSAVLTSSENELAVAKIDSSLTKKPSSTSDNLTLNLSNEFNSETSSKSLPNSVSITENVNTVEHQKASTSNGQSITARHTDSSPDTSTAKGDSEYNSNVEDNATSADLREAKVISNSANTDTMETVESNTEGKAVISRLNNQTAHELPAEKNEKRLSEVNDKKESELVHDLVSAGSSSNDDGISTVKSPPNEDTNISVRLKNKKKSGKVSPVHKRPEESNINSSNPNTHVTQRPRIPESNTDEVRSKNSVSNKNVTNDFSKELAQEISSHSNSQEKTDAQDVQKMAEGVAAPETNGEVPVLNNDEQQDFDSEESTPYSITPPSPVDALRNRFEGLIDGNSMPRTGTIRPQSPFRRMSFNSRKEAIALERKREINTEKKPWFLKKVSKEPVKVVLPKRSIKQQLEIERKVRKMVADRKCRTYRKAEIVVQLMDMNFEEEEAIQAANECSTLEQAISYLQQECLLCAGFFPVSQIISMVHCPHKACRECIRAYFTVQIRDRTIVELLCPFCNEPDISDEDIAQDYFNHLDIMLKKLVEPEIHELFQRKLRDRVLMKDPNFRWCSQCSSGFIANPNLKRLVCPDCNAVTCANCRRPWEREHQRMTCEAFAAWKDATDPEAHAAGLAKLLTEDGIDCPSCHFRYALAKGGCMHFRCIQCQHDFCSGCSRPFKMGQKCGVSEFCAKLGLHAHHPRNCLFYLRDKEPADLQRLLDMNNIKYNKDPPDGMEVNGACQVMEQKETADGMIDDHCGKEVEDGFAGLCRVHYVEYLGQLVNKHKVDPIQIFDNDDLELVLKRASIRLPPKRYRESDAQYREKLVQLIEEELPLDKMDGS